MVKLKRIIASVLVVIIITINSYSAYAAVQSQSIPTQAWNLMSDSQGQYNSSAYTNGYRLYTNYYFLGNLNRCRLNGTSANATSGYHLGIINYYTGYTYLNYRAAGTTSYDIWLDNSQLYPIGNVFYCGFNMYANSSEASNTFFVDCW